MFTDFPVYDPRCARPLCDILDWLYSNHTQPGLSRQLVTEGLTASAVQILNPTDVIPKRAYVQAGEDYFFFFKGTENLAMGRNIVGGYFDTNFGSGAGVYNGAVALAADAIATEIAAWIIIPPKRVYLVGHSYGGAVAQYLATFQVFGAIQPTSLNICTFGAPRFAGTRIANALFPFVNNARWMNENDPVPLIPFGHGDIPLALVQAGVDPAGRAGLFVHPCGGLVLGSDVGIVASMLPTLARANPTGSIVSWLLNWDSDDTNEHGLLTYSNRLTANMPIAGPAEVVPRKESEIVDVHPPQVIRADVANIRQAFRIQEQAQHAIPVEVDPRIGFYVLHEKPFWNVYLGKDRVSVHSNKKGARHLARAGNDFLDSSLHSGCFDAEGVLLELSAFFAQSKIPGSGIQPPVADVAPE